MLSPSDFRAIEDWFYSRYRAFTRDSEEDAAVLPLIGPVLGFTTEDTQVVRWAAESMQANPLLMREATQLWETLAKIEKLLPAGRP